ncbi:MAG: hypothetical protein U0527_06015 [Candidatus Eisenbacteria bacterium]
MPTLLPLEQHLPQLADQRYDLTARRITVPIGSVATDVRGWAYGNVFSPAACVVLGGSPADFSSYAIDLYADTGFGQGPWSLRSAASTL